MVLGLHSRGSSQAPGGAVLPAWGDVAQKPCGAWFARGQHPMLFQVLPC